MFHAESDASTPSIVLRLIGHVAEAVMHFTPDHAGRFGLIGCAVGRAVAVVFADSIDTLALRLCPAEGGAVPAAGDVARALMACSESATSERAPAIREATGGDRRAGGHRLTRSASRVECGAKGKDARAGRSGSCCDSGAATAAAATARRRRRGQRKHVGEFGSLHGSLRPNPAIARVARSVPARERGNQNISGRSGYVVTSAARAPAPPVLGSAAGAVAAPATVGSATRSPRN